MRSEWFKGLIAGESYWQTTAEEGITLTRFLAIGICKHLRICDTENTISYWQGFYEGMLYHVKRTGDE